MSLDFDDWESDLLSRVDRGLKYGKSLGTDAVELYITNSRTLNVKIKGGMIDANQGGNIGVGCRCLTEKKLGFAAASGITNSAINFAIESALKVSKTLLKEDERWSSFVQTHETGKDGKIDPSVLEISSEEVVNGANLIFKEAKEYDSRILSIEGIITIGYSAFAVGNSEGLAKSGRTTFGHIDNYIIASEKEKTKTGVNEVTGRGVPKFEGMGTTGASKAVKLLESKPLDYTGQMKVIFNNVTAAQLINVSLRNSINGASVVEGRSAFADKLGEKIGVSSLTIYDDGQIPEDPNMAAIDDEGFPRRKTLVIEKGVLKSFIFDQYYSQISSKKNTGNSKRRGPQTYESIPKISPTTISIVPGAKDLDDLASEIDTGILITDNLLGMGHSNVISGDFSIVAPNSYKIEKGEITTPIEPISVAGNLYKAFNQIINIGNDSELTSYGKIPSIAFEGFTVSG